MNIIKQKVITCILPKGKAIKVTKVLVKEFGITSIDISYARGVGRITPLSHRGIGETSEKEILTLSVDEAEAEEMFEIVYDLAEISQPHGGLMYMHALSGSTGFELPDLPEEK